MVIGDRKAGATAAEIVHDRQLLVTLRRKIGIEKKFIHVIRNPFDTITTTYHKTRRKLGEKAGRHLSREINNYFVRCTALQRIEDEFGSQSICHVFHEDLVVEPARQLARICQFLGVSHDDDYLQDCASIVKSAPNESRWSLDWGDEHKSRVLEVMAAHSWLERYAVPR
jgi:hypothetical protein